MLGGWIADRVNVNSQTISEANKNTPLFWGHGTDDEIVLPINQSIGVDHLAGCNGVDFPVTARLYKVGHDANELEMDDVLTFVKSILL